VPRSSAAAIRIVVVSLLVHLLCPSTARADAVCARGGVVASACPIATAVGVDILERGGNAVDASVAIGFALAVTYPQAGNIGGGGFMLLRSASGATRFLDFREKAPLGAHRDMYLDERGEIIEQMSLLGAMAVGVPGSVSGLHRAHELHGTLPWSDLLAPAIALSRDGFPVSARLAASLARLQPHVERFPGLRQFAKADGSPLAAGDTLVQPELARTLEIIAEEGPRAFYAGSIADLVVSEMRSSGGIISKEDLAAYATVERAPVRGEYRGYEIVSAPPPSSGGVILIEILHMLEEFDIGDMQFLSDRAIHHIVEAERRAYADRARHLGDPDFTPDKSKLLTSKKYARKLARTITPRATPSSNIAPAGGADREKRETTHYSVVDRWGNAAATTVTLNDGYGSRLVVRGAGFLLNNEMDDFSAKPGVPNLYGLVGSAANAIEPGKRMLSSMAPTIVLKDGNPVLVLGTPGGSTIITTVAQVVINVVDFGMTLEGAVAAPRFHHQWLPDHISFERGVLTRYLRGFLEERGHRIEERSEPIGDVQAIAVHTDCACGVSDPRGGGAAGGIDIVEPAHR
jgi:gamma-glutamyltranspeptidase/glutathione hydrolase